MLQRVLLLLLLAYSNSTIMEDDKKKFLLCKIKREQALITGQFQRFKKQYQAREIPPEKNDAFLEHITHTMQINNSLAANLYEYLDKAQVQAVLQRVNGIFTDLIQKYRKCKSQLTFLQSPQNIKEIRQICDVCHEKIETNRIENIRKGLDAESECRSAVIKRLIEQSELERTTPVFSAEEDKEFKRQLEKVFQNKETMLQTTIHESNIFLETVEEEMAEFMVSFRRDFAEWGGGQQVEVENENWGKMMKGLINKKLTNSFNNKIPSWIKKMRDLFVDHHQQASKPKQYFMNKEIQADFPTENQEKIKQELQDMSHALILKRQALKMKEEELEHEKIRSKALKNQLDSLHQFYMDKLYPNKEEGKEGKERKTPQISDFSASQSIRQSAVQLGERSQIDRSELIERQVISTHKKKKFVKMAYQMLQKSPKEFKSSDNLMFSQNIATSRNDLTSEKSSENHQLYKEAKETSAQRNPSFAGQQELLKLKKKVFNRQKREDAISEIEKKNQSVSYADSKVSHADESKQKDKLKGKMKGGQKQKDKPKDRQEQREKEKQSLKQKEKENLKNQVRQICDEISKDLPIKKAAKGKMKRFNSISVTENATQDIPSTQANESLAVILPFVQSSNKNLSKELGASPEKHSKHATVDYNVQRDGLESQQFSEAVNHVIEVSKQQHFITQQDKHRLNKLIHNFFTNLQRRPANSISFKSVKLSQVVISQSNKQNLPFINTPSPCQNANPNRSLKKQKSKHSELYQRKNKSLHANVLKLPAISIKNYSHHDVEDLSVFTKNNISLFIDQHSAEQYQDSFSPSHQRQFSKPTPSQLQEIQRIFSQLQALKRRSSVTYANFCMFLRYPHTSLRQKSVTVSQVGNINFPTFCNYFLKVLWIHRACQRQQNEIFCPHIAHFKTNISSLLPDRKTTKIKRSQRAQ